MTSEQITFLQNLYELFNRQEIEALLALMKPDVKWANGMEGGFVYGREAIREYWTKQFEMFRAQLTPTEFVTDEQERNVVTVDYVIRDLEGKLLLEKTGKQLFTIEDGLVSLFELSDAEKPLTQAFEQNS